MKTLVVREDGKLEVQEVEKPRFHSKQALVKMICCGICNGTDAKLIHKNFKGFGEDQYPLMLGHEGVGEVVEVGKDVKGLQVGDKVLLPFVDADKERYGRLHSGWGAFSEYGVVDDPEAYGPAEAPECAYGQTKLPDDIDPVDGCMIITLREVLSSIKRFGIQADQSVAVFGCGPVGLTFIRFMSLLGVSPIIAFDVVPEKLEEAKKAGADYAFDSRAGAKEHVRGICPEGVDYMLDAVGISALINQGMELIRDGGKICCYGISPNLGMELDWSKAPYNWQLQFQQFPSKIEEGEVTQQILAWIRTGGIDLKDYISDYFRFEDVLGAFEKLDKKQIAKKGIVVF